MGEKTELNYRVIGLEQRSDKVIMVIIEHKTVPPEEIERARLEAELEPEDIVDVGEQVQKVDFAPTPKTQEEKLMAAMRTQMPEVFEGLKSLGAFPPPRPRRPRTMRVSRIPDIVPPLEIYLTKEEYTKLNPAIFQVITLTLAVSDVPY